MEQLPEREKFSLNELRAFLGAFGILLLCLVAISIKSIVPLFFIVALAPVLRYGLTDDVVDKENDEDTWEGI